MSKWSRVAVIGVGNMGEALVKGILDRGILSRDALVGAEVNQPRRETIAERYGIAVYETVAEACREARVIILAVKPQEADATLREMGGLGNQALVVSICAGVSLAQIARSLPEGAAAVRVMPNTPALVGCGASVYCANEAVTAEGRAAVEALLGAVGEVHEVTKEPLLDAVTGLSGSGPAYVFTFLEALADGGVLMGLPRPLAQALARQTVLGAALLAAQDGTHTAELKDRVTSPGGTTIAGLRELELAGFRGAVLEAVRAATERSRQLGG